MSVDWTRAEQLVQDMRAKGKRYQDLSPSGKKLLDSYRTFKLTQSKPAPPVIPTPSAIRSPTTTALPMPSPETVSPEAGYHGLAGPPGRQLADPVSALTGVLKSQGIDISRPATPRQTIYGEKLPVSGVTVKEPVTARRGEQLGTAVNIGLGVASVPSVIKSGIDLIRNIRGLLETAGAVGRPGMSVVRTAWARAAAATPEETATVAREVNAARQLAGRAAGGVGNLVYEPQFETQRTGVPYKRYQTHDPITGVRIEVDPARRVNIYSQFFHEMFSRVVGNDMGQLVLRAKTSEDRILGPRYRVLREAGLQSLSDAEDLNVRQMLASWLNPNEYPTVKPLSDRAMKVASILKHIFADDAESYKKMGQVIFDPNTGDWRPFAEIRGYYPRMWDPVGTARVDAEKLATAFMVDNPGMGKEEALRIADYLTARAEARGAYLPDLEKRLWGVGHSASHLHARGEIKIPEMIIRPIKESVAIYLRDAARERAMLETFGPKDGLLIDALDKAGGFGRELTPGTPQTAHPDAADLKREWYRYRGWLHDEDFGQPAAKIGRLLNNIATATLVDFTTTIKHVNRFAAVLAENSIPHVVEGFFKAFTRGGKIEAEDVGAFVQDLTRELLYARGSTPTTTMLDKAIRLTQRAATAKVKLSGIQGSRFFFGVDPWMRTVTYHARLAELRGLRSAAITGNPRAIAQLEKLGLKGTSSWLDFQSVAKEYTDSRMVRPDVFHTPYVLSKPWATLMRGLNMFHYGWTGMLLRDFIGPAIRTRNPEDLLRLAKFIGYSLPVGEAIGTAVATVTGRDVRPGGPIGDFVSDLAAGRVPGKVVIARVVTELADAATFGMLSGVLRASVTQAGINVRKGLTRIPQEVTSLLEGAGIGQIAGLVNVGGQIASRAAETPKPGRQAAHQRAMGIRSAEGQLVRRTPGGSITQPRFFASEKSESARYAYEIARAIRRKDNVRAAALRREFYQKFRRSIPDHTINQALQSLAH